MNLRIIVPCYNSSKFIEDTFNNIEKVLNYNNHLNIHVFFIDDGSTDNTLSILNELCKELESFFVFHKSNGGEGSARNFGLDIKKEMYDYVFFVDSDDNLSDNFNYACIKLKELKPDILTCSYIQTDAESLTVLKTYNQISNVYSKNSALKQFLYRNFVPGIGNTFFKKGNVRFSKFKLGADSLYAFENIISSNYIIGHPAIVYDYKIRRGSAMDSQSFDNLKVALIIKNYISSNFKNLITASNFFLTNEMFGYYQRTNKIINSNKKLFDFKWFFEISLRKKLKIIIYKIKICLKFIKN